MGEGNNIFFFHKPTVETEQKLAPLKDMAIKHGFQIVDDFQQADIIVSFGGDGAFIQALHKTDFKEDCLYFALNTGDHLGFYADFPIDQFEFMMNNINKGDFKILKYPTIEVTIDNQKPFYCINECSIRSNVIRTFVIDVFIDDLLFETFRGDGLIASTPTGSTAYNKSVGGAVVDPRIPSIQLTEIASINNNEYRTLSSPLILSDHTVLTLKIVQDGNDHPVIGADNEALSIRHCHDVQIKVGDRKVSMLKMKDCSFFRKVRKTFLN